MVNIAAGLFNLRFIDESRDFFYQEKGEPSELEFYHRIQIIVIGKDFRLDLLEM